MSYKLAMKQHLKSLEKYFAEMTLHRNDKFRTLGDKNTIKVRGKQTAVNPSQFYNRITYILKTSSEMKDFLLYELALQPHPCFMMA